jgi:hypothetical protein
VQDIKHHTDMLQAILRFFQMRGTALDVLHMTLAYQIVQLITASNTGSKADYVIIASRAIHMANHLVYSIEKVMDKGDLTSIYGKPSVCVLFGGSHLVARIKDVAKSIKAMHVKQLMAMTRVAVGAWVCLYVMGLMKAATECR